MKKIFAVLLVLALALLPAQPVWTEDDPEAVVPMEEGGSCDHPDDQVTPATCVSPAHCNACGQDIGEPDPDAHLWAEDSEYVQPTCVSPGYWLFTCQYDETHTFIEEDGDSEIDPNNHSWSAWEPTADGTGHTRHCQRQGCEARSSADHEGGTATCKAKAKCSVCGGAYGELAEHQYHPNVWYHDENDHWHCCNVCDQDSPHEAHSGGTPTCTEQAKCDACRNLYGEPLGHEIVFVDFVFPTCTEDGMLEHYECTRCGKVFGDAAGTREVEKDRFVMTAYGHTEVVDAAVAPTCTENGLTEGKHCALCGEVLEAQKVVPALGHELVHHDGKAATCTEAGTEAYWKCTRCDKLFSDAEGKNEIAAPAAIEALGHQPSYVVLVDPTCTEEGMREHYECTRCDKLFIEVECYNEITAPAAIPALGHDYHVVARGDGAETYECRRCKDRYTKKIANNTSEPLDDLVQDQAGQAVPYRMEAVNTPAGKAVVVTPDVDQNAQRPTLCLTQEVVEKWLEEGFTFTWFVNGEATLEIDLHKLDFEWFFPNIGDMDAQSKAPVLISTWSNGEELGVLVNALTATMERVSVTGLAGLTLRIGDTTVDVTLDAEGKFTYTLLS